VCWFIRGFSSQGPKSLLRYSEFGLQKVIAMMCFNYIQYIRIGFLCREQIRSDVMDLFKVPSNIIFPSNILPEEAVFDNVVVQR